MKVKTIFQTSFLYKIRLFPIICLIYCFSMESHAQGYPFITTPDNDQSNNIRNYLMKVAEGITYKALTGINSFDDWEKIRDQRYNQLIESLGLVDVPMNGARSDLNVRITGTIKMNGYRIEKLYYESLPSLYVPANLYIPENNEKPCPAILYLCGHASDQKVKYQDYARKFAQLGFVCLIVETIQLGEVLGEHHGCYAKGWFNWYSRGYTPAGVEVWNAIRGIDLLCSRKEVNTENIGVTGGSGGGAQSWFVAAADKRIKAVAPSSGATTINEHILTRTIDGHCDCMMPVNSYQLDFNHIGALIAPRALLIVQGDRDRLNAIEGVHEIYKDIKKIYEFYGVPEKVGLLESHTGHSTNPGTRQMLFSFFLEQLKGAKLTKEFIRNIDEAAANNLSAEELKAYVDGPPIDDRTKTIQDSFIKLNRMPEISDENQLYTFRDDVLTFLRKKTFGAFPKIKSPLDPHMVFRSVDQDKFGSNIYSFTPEDGWRLKIDIRWKYSPSDKKPLIIVLRKAGDRNRGIRGEEDSEKFINGKVDDGNIAYFDTRGVGDTGWDPGLQWHIRRASAWTGRTIASMQVYDVLRCIEFCRTLPGVDAGKIGIAAREDMAAVALYAALLDGNCHTLLLKDPPATQDCASQPDGKGEAIEMLNCLRITDVCFIPALIPSTNLWFVGEIPDSYQWAENIRVKLGKTPFIQSKAQ